MEVNVTAGNNVLSQMVAYFAVFPAISNVGCRIVAELTIPNVLFLVLAYSLLLGFARLSPSYFYVLCSSCGATSGGEPATPPSILRLTAPTTASLLRNPFSSYHTQKHLDNKAKTIDSINTGLPHLSVSMLNDTKSMRWKGSPVLDENDKIDLKFKINLAKSK